MRHAILMAGISVLAISGSAFAQNSVPLNSAVIAAPSTQPAQLQVQAPPGTVITTPASPSKPASTTVVVTAPTEPPPPRVETPPPAPGPSYVWMNGHWGWDGAQYVWTPGHYVVPPTTVARWTPGYWQQDPNGWVWIEGSWN